MQKWQLNFQGVLAQVRGGIVPQPRKLAFERLRQWLVDGDFSQRSLPVPPAHDGERLPCSGVIRTEDDKAARQFQTPIDRAGYSSGIDIAGVGHHAAESA